ncbi:MAG: ADP-ribosylation factor-like protein [Candidatus Heimdallarchaeaceae archaeon]
MYQQEQHYDWYKRDVVVSIAGLDGAGKTRIVQKILQEEVTEYIATYGVNQEVICIEGIQLGLTDLGGKEPFRKTLWKSYISSADGLIYVVDVTKQERLDESKKWFQKSIQWLHKKNPVLILLNTWDSNISTQVLEKIIRTFKNLAKSRPVETYPVSPISGHNLSKAIEWLASTLIQNLIAEGVSVDLFITYLKTPEGIMEARIRSHSFTHTDEAILPVIRYKFASKGEKLLEYLFFQDRQIILTADEKTSCWLITSKSIKIKSAPLLMNLMSEFLAEIQGIRETNQSKVKESDLINFLIKYMIDKQKFWSKDESPMFEVTFLKES